MPTSHLFHSFCENPDVCFAVQDKNEKIHLIVREHPVTLVSSLIVVLALFIIPLLFGQWLNSTPLSAVQQVFLILSWYAVVFSYVLGKIFFWYFNIGIVTSKKIVDIDIINLLNSQTTATTIAKVEEVHKKTRGILSSLFNFGDIFIQTASEMPNIEFMNTPYPSRMVTIINNLMQKTHEHN